MKASAVAFLGVVHVTVGLYAQRSDFKDADFRRADSVASLYPNHSLIYIKLLAGKLTAPFHSEEEKFRAIYTWICRNVESDYKLYQENKRNRETLKNREELDEWNKKFCRRVFNKLLSEQKTICSGYAYLLKELAFHAGITCVTVDGYGRTAQANVKGTGTLNHSWNAVRLNNKWYLCDATWSSGIIDGEHGRFVRKYDDSFFLADPPLFVRTHYPSDTAWMLLNHKPTLQEFLNGPLMYAGAYEYEVHPLFPGTFDISAAKGETISFSFRKNSSKEIEKLEFRLKGLDTPDSFYPQMHEELDDVYCFDHIFTTKGAYVVHILLNGVYAFTYNVRVR